MGAWEFPTLGAGKDGETEAQGDFSVLLPLVLAPCCCWSCGVGPEAHLGGATPKTHQDHPESLCSGPSWPCMGFSTLCFPGREPEAQRGVPMPSSVPMGGIKPHKPHGLGRTQECHRARPAEVKPENPAPSSQWGWDG